MKKIGNRQIAHFVIFFLDTLDYSGKYSGKYLNFDALYPENTGKGGSKIIDIKGLIGNIQNREMRLRDKNQLFLYDI